MVVGDLVDEEEGVDGGEVVVIEEDGVEVEAVVASLSFLVHYLAHFGSTNRWR